MMKKLFFTFAILSMLTTGASAFDIAYDGFESGDFNGGIGWSSGWWHQGDVSVVIGDNPYAGNYHLKIGKRNAYLDRTASLTSFTNAKLTLYAKVKSYEGADFTELLVSPDGLNWTVLKTFTLADSDNQYHSYEYDITPYLSDSFWLAVDSEAGSGDYLFLDEIKITTNDTIEIPEIPTWHIQYNPTPANPEADVQYWNLDLFDVSNETMQQLSSQGTFVMCYFSAGSWEDWREDAGQFPQECLGKSNGWPGERWLDTRCQSVRNIMINRINLGIAKGCDGFDPDNMDGYQGDTGFPLTEQDAINYYNFLANYTHSQGRQIGLKNALNIIDSVLPNMDWAVNEQCYQYSECGMLNQVLFDGKPVFHIEYPSEHGMTAEELAEQICELSNMQGLATLIKNMQLDEFEISCLGWANQSESNITGIAYDGFESGWSGGFGWTTGWWYEGDAKIITADGPYEGSYHLRLRRANGYVDRRVDLSNVSNAKLTFYAKVKSFESRDFAEVKVVSNGTEYVLDRFTFADSDNQYRYYEYDLTPYGLASDFYIAFDAEMSGTGDYLYVDRILIREAKDLAFNLMQPPYAGLSGPKFYIDEIKIAGSSVLTEDDEREKN